jgi:hypothetical protein
MSVMKLSKSMVYFAGKRSISFSSMFSFAATNLGAWKDLKLMDYETVEDVADMSVEGMTLSTAKKSIQQYQRDSY